MKKQDFEIDLDPSWTIKQLHQKVKEDIMTMLTGLAVKDITYVDQMKIYMLENSEFTPLDISKTCGEQNVKSGGHLLFTRAPKESLSMERYSPEGRLRRGESGGF